VVPRTARNWLRSPKKSLEWIWEAVSYAAGVRKELTLLPDWKLICHPHVYRTFLDSQLHDPEQNAEFLSFVRHARTGMFLFDIGANYGVFSLAAAHFGGKAIAVDPSPIATRFAAVESRLNGFENDIRVIEACASDSSGETWMLSAGVFSDGYFTVASGRSKRELTKTRTVTVDELCQDFGPPTHLKIDVEGYEAAVLRGARATIERHTPLLFLELHNEKIRAEGADPGGVLDLLAEMRYELFSVDDAKLSRDAILQEPIFRLVGKIAPHA
jgi:FkbM family methyltransferase